jgi:hypothetical protein
MAPAISFEAKPSFAGWIAAAGPFGAGQRHFMAAARQTRAAAPSDLGRSQVAAETFASAQEQTDPRGGHDHPLVEGMGFERAAAPAASVRPADFAKAFARPDALP